MSSTVQLNKRPSHQIEKPSPIPHMRVDDDTVIETMFSMGRKLGQGSFGVVREAVDLQSGKKWAVKAVNKEKAGSSAVKLLEREVSILKKVNHEHIIHLEKVYETSKRMYLVMELCEHGELADLLKAQTFFPEEVTKKIITDLASAITYLHKIDIVHRDLKLENILVHKNADDGTLHIKVTDFGLSVVKDGVGHENMMQQFCGTPIYMPPEIVDNKTYSQQCDVWAMGVITYYLLSGYPPFKARDEETLYEYIKKGEISFREEHIKDCSTAAHQCIQGMLKVDPAHRLTASEVLNHHWITGVQNGSAVGNVLELMKQFKNELSVEDESEETSEAVTPPDSSPSPPANAVSSTKSLQKSSQKGKPKPRSAGSSTTSSSVSGCVSGSQRFLGYTNSHQSPAGLSGCACNMSTCSTITYSAAPSHQSIAISPPSMPDTYERTRQTRSAGRRPLATTIMPTVQNRSSPNTTAFRQKQDKSPPNLSTKPNTKKK